MSRTLLAASIALSALLTACSSGACSPQCALPSKTAGCFSPAGKTSPIPATKESLRDMTPKTRWSDYVFDAHYEGDNLVFGYSCGASDARYYTIKKTQVVSLGGGGICYQYSLNYLVFDY